MNIKMELLSDAVFGNGESVPGGEDIGILTDAYGFPYYKGGTFKGVLREEMGRYLAWKKDRDSEGTLTRLFGEAGSDDDADSGKLILSDFTIPDAVKQAVLAETTDPQQILDAMTNMRSFTAISEDGTVKKGSYRYARCVNKGLIFTSSLECPRKDLIMTEGAIPMVKWIGSMRNRGFGRVRLTIMEERRR